MHLHFRPMDADAARAAIGWRYSPPYDIYNVPAGADETVVAFLTDPHNSYYRIDDNTEMMVAFCCFGEDGRVPGGDYRTPALDIGLGVRPDLTGQGQGGQFVRAVCDFAGRSFTPPALRVTIAAWNLRAQRVWERNGFSFVGRFFAQRTGAPFVILARTNV